MSSKGNKNLTVLFLFCCFATFTSGVFGQDAESGASSAEKASKNTVVSAPETINDRSHGEILPAEQKKLNADFQTVQCSAGCVSETAKKQFINQDIKENSNFESQPQVAEFSHHFLANDVQKNSFYINDAAKTDPQNSLDFPLPEFFNRRNKTKPIDDSDDTKSEKFDWRSAVSQSLIFLGVQHGYALTQPKTRRALKGKFFKDYIDSVKALQGWDDGGRFFTNYIAHPMQGAFTGFIYVQNDPKARKQQFGADGDYWRSRLKAMAWTAAWSTQFEIGPISQASIGNVGLSGKQTWEDIVVTPTLGTAMLVAEDAADRFIVKAIERRTSNFYIRIFSRMLLSPTRNFSNMLRFKAPWYRDRPYDF